MRKKAEAVEERAKTELIEESLANDLRLLFMKEADSQAKKWELPRGAETVYPVGCIFPRKWAEDKAEGISANASDVADLIIKEFEKSLGIVPDYTSRIHRSRGKAESWAEVKGYPGKSDLFRSLVGLAEQWTVELCQTKGIDYSVVIVQELGIAEDWADSREEEVMSELRAAIGQDMETWATNRRCRGSKVITLNEMIERQ